MSALACMAVGRPLDIGGGGYTGSGAVISVASAITNSVYGANLTTEPSGSVNGSRLLLGVAWYGGGGNATCSVSGWTAASGRADNVAVSGQHSYVQLFTRLRGASAIGTTAPSITDGGGDYLMWMARLTAADATDVAALPALEQESSPATGFAGYTLVPANALALAMTAAYTTPPTGISASALTWTQQTLHYELRIWSAPVAAGSIAAATLTGSDASRVGLLSVLAAA